MEIKNFRDINRGCLKSAFTIMIPEWAELEIDCAYFEKDNGSFWINYAAKDYTTRDGQKKSHNQARWPKPISDRLTKAIRDKIKAGQMQYKEPPANYQSPQQAEEIGQDENLPF